MILWNSLPLLFFIGLPYVAIAAFFNIGRKLASKIFKEILNAHHKVAEKFLWWFTKDQVASTMPDCFKGEFSNVRVMIDCFEVRIQVPRTSVRASVLTFSNYKSGNTAKILVGAHPCGLFSFVSRAYGGRATDGFITNDCGILDLLEEGDKVLADKGKILNSIHITSKVTFRFFKAFPRSRRIWRGKTASWHYRLCIDKDDNLAGHRTRKATT